MLRRQTSGPVLDRPQRNGHDAARRVDAHPTSRKRIPAPGRIPRRSAIAPPPPAGGGVSPALPEAFGTQEGDEAADVGFARRGGAAATADGGSSGSEDIDDVEYGAITRGTATITTGNPPPPR